MAHKFDPAKLTKLDNPARREILPPEKIVTMLAVKPGEIVADLGCGIGYLTMPLAHQVAPEGIVYGIDLSEEMLTEADHRVTAAGLVNIKLIQATETKIPLPDEASDLALLCNVYHELEDRTGYLIEISRVLKSAGRVVIIDWIRKETPIGPPLAERLMAEEVQEELRQAGYNIGRVEQIGPANYFIEAWLNFPKS